MKIVLDVELDANGNAQAYFEKAKEARKKREHLEVLLKTTLHEIERERRRDEFAAMAPVVVKAPKVKVVRERDWFEKFHWFNTSTGELAVGGKEAKQNDQLFARHFEEHDLFFHADVHGASAVILKNGAKASEQAILEAAQFSTCYSSAWKAGLLVADSWAATKSQVSKYSTGEYVAKGAFMVYGEKKWFKRQELKLFVAKENGLPIVLPGCFDFTFAGRTFEKKVLLVPGSVEKKEVAKKLLEKLSLDAEHLNELMRLLPGSSEIQ